MLCVVQFLLVGISLVVSLRWDADHSWGNGPLWLAVVQSIPAPALVIAMLLIEQSVLAGSAGARPEHVGRVVGVTAAVALAAVTLVTLLIPRGWLGAAHQVFSALLLLACMFVPLLQDALPQAMAQVDWRSLGILAGLSPVAGVVVLLGWWRWNAETACR